jgi:hypothetical protein
MVYLCRLDDETFWTLFGKVDDIIVVNGSPFELFLVFFTMCHEESPLDLYPDIGDVKILIFELVQKILQS